MGLADRIKSQSPDEIHLLGWAYFLFFFLNAGEFFGGRFRFEDLFEYSDSAAFSLIETLGFRGNEAHPMFWLLLVTYVVVLTVRAKAISNWLWQVN